MKKTAISLAIAALIPAVANAEVIDFYGKANVSFQSQDEGEGSHTDVQSNASRLGVRGELPFDNGMSGIYRMEYQVDISGRGSVFSQRNIYAGLKGEFGEVIAGRFDTPLKTAEKRVDLFNDLVGDIDKSITGSQKREANSVQYTTPAFAGFRAKVDYVSHRNAVIGQDDLERDITREDGISTSIAYDNDGIYLAYAFDRDVLGNDWDVQRLVGQYNIGALQLGALVEQQEGPDGGKQDGWMTSLAYKVSDPWTLKAQYGQSDMVVADAKNYSLGADYRLTSAAKIFGFWTHTKADGDYERKYFGIGTEMNF